MRVYCLLIEGRLAGVGSSSSKSFASKAAFEDRCFRRYVLIMSLCNFSSESFLLMTSDSFYYSFFFPKHAVPFIYFHY